MFVPRKQFIGREMATEHIQRAKFIFELVLIQILEEAVLGGTGTVFLFFHNKKASLQTLFCIKLTAPSNRSSISVSSLNLFQE